MAAAPVRYPDAVQVFAQRIHRPGGPGALVYEAVDVPPLGGEDVLVRHTAIGVNTIDVYHRTGLYPLPSLPHGLGVEAAGVVEAVGPGVRGLAAGRRVAWLADSPGTYAEASIVPASRLVSIPDDVADETAAAILLKGMTVEMLIRRVVRVERGMPVLFHSAAGGVGSIACPWLRELGAYVIGTVGRRSKVDHAKRLGCHRVVVRDEEDVVDVVMDATRGRGVAVAYDGVGRDTLLSSLDCVEKRGTLVAFGNASGRPDPVDVLRLASRYLIRPSLYDYVGTSFELLTSALAVFDAVRRGAVRPRSPSRWPLAEAAVAQEALESGATTGSLLLLP